ncbi:amino acid adenylation domain-containing protein [Sphingobacterium faecium]|uniref:amino acid adenylation domain-containing protein n=1 Tax=Sphingobacterium faecium TaxID=34087 RepID=UPI00320B990A
MKMTDLIEEIRTANIYVEVVGDQLKLDVSKTRPSDELLNKIRRNKTELITYLKRQNVIEIQPAPKCDYYPASSEQKRLYALQMLDKDCIVYNLLLSYVLKGELNFERVENTFKELINRHESFRTSIVFVNGELVQKVESDVAFKIEYQHYSEQNLEQFIYNFSRPFNLDVAPLIRVGLYQKDDIEHVMLIEMHHCISDGISLSVAMKDFRMLYDKQHLPDQTIHYKDYIVWKRTETSPYILDYDRSFWLEQFSGEIPILNLVTDYPRQPTNDFNGNVVVFNLDEYTTSEIHEKCKQNRITLYSFLLSAFKILLSKYSNQDDIIVGTVSAGRDREELKSIIGMFANTLAIRSRPLGSKRFLDYASEIKDICLEAFDHQNYPFEELVSDLNSERTMGRNPLFDILFVLQNMTSEEFTIGDLDVNYFPIRSKHSKFDISLTTLERDSKITMLFEYKTSLFNLSTIQSMGRQFVYILETLSKNIELVIKDITLVPQQELLDEITTFNNTYNFYPKNKTVIHLLEEQSRLFPQSEALVFGNYQISYSEFSKKVDLFASFLLSEGIGKGDLVGLIARRSADLVAAIYGILKISAAYLPIDPSYPSERIDYVVKDSNLKYILFDEEFKARKKMYRGSSFGSALSSKRKINLENYGLPRPNDLAYIIYTSGSTGEPKGVAVKHYSLTNLLYSLNRLYPCLKNDSFLFKTSYCFDVSISEIFGWIFNGGKLVILENGSEAIPAEIEATVAKYNITHINFVPSMFAALLDSIKNRYLSRYASIKYFFVAGEILSSGLVEIYKATGLTAKVVNLYGPTETTVYASYYQLDDWNSTTRVPIGKPLDNIKLYILDENMKPQTIGIPGEIYIGGSAIAMGYMNQQELTVEKFVKDPYERNSFLYKSGDLGRRLSCGNIEYLTRMDNQIKVRGYRIELGEIEAVLNAYSYIKESVVIAIEVKGSRCICAFIVSDFNLNLKEIKDFIATKLPTYMIPEFLLQIDSVPLLSNGKIDRKNLPNPKLAFAKAANNQCQQMNALEKKLCEIWAKNLGISLQNITTDTTYFELGGNSLKLISLLSSINKEFNIDISLRNLYINKTINKLGDFIASLNHNKQNRYPTINHVPGDLYKPFSLSNIQFAYLVGRNSQLELGNVATHSFWKTEGDADIENVNRCLNILIERHHALRTVVSGDGQQVILERKEYRIHCKDITHKSRSEQLTVSLEIEQRMSQQIFDASKWPLFEIVALKVGVQKYIFFVSFDTIVADAYSIELIKKEFKYLYNVTEANLEQPGITFRDYIIALNKFKESSFYTDDKEYWMEKLYDFPNSPLLPLKRNLADIKKPVFKAIKKSFTVHESNLIKKKSKDINVSLSVFLLTVYAEVLSYWSNQSDLAINLTFFNRLPIHESIDQVVGDFTSLILLGIRFQENESFNARVASVQETLLEALDHRLFDGVEFIREIAKQRNLAKKAIMPVVFTSALFDTVLSSSDIGDRTLSITRDRINLDRGTPTSQVYLDNVVGEHEGRIFLIWNYVEELFWFEDINRMFDMYIAKIYDLITSTSEFTKSLNKQLGEFYQSYNHTNIPNFSNDYTIHEIISRQCQLTPNSIAVSLGTETITYKELDRESNRVANYLVSNGIQKSNTVCVFGERKIDTIINIIGVMKAGAIYVPLNPDNPLNRNKLIQLDCNAQVLLDCQIYQDQIKNRYSDFFEIISISPHDSAYIIYTSGSTGIPKGVIIAHVSAINTILDINERFSVGLDDRILQISSFSFDLSIYDIFGSLMSGAQLVMIETNKDISRIINTLLSDKITIFNAVPSFWKLVLENLTEDNLLENLRHVLLSGDWIPVDLAKETINRFPDIRLTSLGGATEGSIWSIYYPVEKVDPNWKSIPYGYPLKNQQFYVLNFENEICPVGVMGMLFIGGIGVTKGYLNNPDQTDQCLVMHETYGLLYMTGDYGVMSSEGYIEFLGRKDDQVKIKGHRIELGEIEKNLNSIEGIKESLVTVQKNQNRDAIVAYVIERFFDNNLKNSVLLDPLERLKFKIAQHNSNALSGGEKGINLVKNITDKITVAFSPTQVDNDIISDSIRFIHIEFLLEFLRQFNLREDYPFPQYLYPSAGGLYPVQVYLYISERSLTGLEVGYYYYNPKYHSIIPLEIKTNKLNEKHDKLLIIARTEAIEPMYGDRAMKFCFLEAGHMIALLNNVSCTHNIGLARTVVDNSTLNTLGLRNGYSLINCYRMGYIDEPKDKKNEEFSVASRHSYRNFSNDVIALNEFCICLQKCTYYTLDCSDISIYVYVKTGVIDGVKRGYYFFDKRTSKLEEVSRDELVSSAYLDKNKEIFDVSGFAIFLTADTKNDDLDKLNSSEHGKESLFEKAGRIGQNINMIFPSNDLGVCAIGALNMDIINQSLKVEKDDIIYTFLGGRIGQGLTEPGNLNELSHELISLEDRITKKLRQNLPEYMIPERIISIDRFPLTQNGKINRKLLPLPDFSISNRKFIAPHGTVEEKLFELISQLLDNSKFGSTDDFFESGGDSLKAMALIARINNNFNTNINLNDLFSNPTIRELAQHIQSIELNVNEVFENKDRYQI